MNVEADANFEEPNQLFPSDEARSSLAGEG